MNILFCSEPFNNKKVDPEWEQEYQIAKKYGFEIHFLDYEMLRNEENIGAAFAKIKKPETKKSCIYRGWMMPIETYEVLYQSLLERNLELINNPEQYKYCYYLPESYDLIKQMTPKTVWIDKNFSSEQLKDALSSFDNRAIIIKDYVKSQKHHWFEACYIPNANDFEFAQRIVKRFIELQRENLEEGLIFREFVELESIGIHPKSKMPLTKEYRIFVLNKIPIAVIPYWNDINYTDNEIPLNKFNPIFNKVQSNFYTVDIAKLKNGNWIIIELGDGQVAEYMGIIDLDNFYQRLLGVDS
jgi:hypothetical protein